MNFFLVAPLAVVSTGVAVYLGCRWLDYRQRQASPPERRKTERERRAAADRLICTGIILRSYSNEELSVLTEHSEWIRAHGLDGGES